MRARLTELARDYVAPVSLKSLVEVERLAPRLRESTTVSALLMRYQPLDEKLDTLERVIDRVSVEWDRWVQHEIDLARGK
jgi:hypothetical protein